MNPTLVGFSAILLWSLLALLTAATGTIPPFQLLAMTFAIGGLCGLASWPFRRNVLASLKLPAKIWIFGIAGLFGYHFFYYTALRNAPVAEAGMIAYLWPLLIVIGSALLPNERLRTYHIIGAILGLSGAGLLILGKFNDGNFGDYSFGYISAMICALVWSAYSIISRHFKDAPTDAVTIYCLATAVLSTICHLTLETTIWPENTTQWLAVAGLGLGPVGLAFYAWDYGVKKGNIQLLGSAAYFAPILSTFALVAAGYAELSWRLGVAVILVTLGALVASGKFTTTIK
ncbi:MAG: EamA family transporter [Rhizobiaceae bacterium]